MSIKKEFNVALVGNPNSGKSAIFNSLTGARQSIGNWPGVTVEKKAGLYLFNQKKVNIVDLPGSYSLKAQTDDEAAACRYILSNEADLYLNIIDANNLERNLYLTMQLIELKKPMILIINMLDIASRHNISIDVEALKKSIGLPIIAVSAVKKGADQQIKMAIDKALTTLPCSALSCHYPDEIEQIIANWQDALEQASRILSLNSRYIAIKLLENDSSVITPVLATGKLSSDDLDQAKQHVRLKLSSNPATLIAEQRYKTVHALAEEAVSKNVNSRPNVTNRIDQVVLNKYAGIPIFLFIMYTMFWVVQKVGGSFQDFFELTGIALFVDLPKTLLTTWAWPEWLVIILANGVGSGLATVASFIPLIFVMFLCLSLLEDSGYMSRAAFIIDRAMRSIGLPGKSFVPLIVGFGCTVPAIIATRSLESKRDKILTIFMAPMMSCGARLPVLSLFGAAFFADHSALMIFSIYLLGIIVAVLTALLLSKTYVKGAASHFIMELPAYHLPRFTGVVKHAYGRLKDFIFRAGKFIVVAMIILGSLNTITLSGNAAEDDHNTVLAVMGQAMTPLFSPFGVEKENWQASVALLTGVFAKEAIIGSLAALYSMDEIEGEGEDDPFSLTDSLKEALSTIPANLSDAFSNSALIDSDSGEDEATEALLSLNMQRAFTQGKWQVYAYLIFVLLYVPCMAAMGAATKELGSFYGFILFLYLTLISWSFATLFYQVVLGHSFLWISVALLIILLVVLFFTFLNRFVPLNDEQPKSNLQE